MREERYRRERCAAAASPLRQEAASAGSSIREREASPSLADYAAALLIA
jgi:hypothetical protein